MHFSAPGLPDLGKQEYDPPPRAKTPMTQEEDGQKENILAKLDEKVNKYIKVAELQKSPAEVSSFEKIKIQVTWFFGLLSEMGREENSKNKASVVAGTTTAVAVHSCFTNNVSDIFKSNVNDVVRTAFSGLCILSAALRATIPVMRQLATDSHDPIATTIFTGALFVLSCVYAATSFINFLLASQDAIALQPKNSEVMTFLRSTYENAREEIRKFLSKPEKAEAISNWAISKIEQKLESVRNITFNGGVNTARELLMLAGAVLSIVALKASVPVLLIAAGAVGVVANCCDVIQGVHNCYIFSKKLNSLEEKKTKLELGLNNPTLSPEQKTVVRALLSEIKDEIDKTRSGLRAHGLRVAKGALGMLCSIASIVTGVLATFFSITVPILPLVATVASLVAVSVLSSVALTRKKIEEQDADKEKLKYKAANEILPVVDIDNKTEIPLIGTEKEFLNKYYLVGFVMRDFLRDNKAHEEMYKVFFSNEQREILEKIVRSYKAGRAVKNLEARIQVRRLEQQKRRELRGKLEALQQPLGEGEGLEAREKQKLELHRQIKTIQGNAGQELIQLDEKERLEREEQLKQLEQEIAHFLQIKIDRPKAEDKRLQETTGASVTNPSSHINPTSRVLNLQTVPA
jgi:hypothetical protein